jgi:single-strand DNA-binding protein
MATITINGLVATTPRHIVTQDGVPITSFRIASDDGNSKNITSWFTVTSYRSLAINVATSISKGDRVTIQGDLKIRDWDNGERAGTTAEIDAKHIGHDLAWGSSVFTRTVFKNENAEEATDEN